MVYSSTVGRHNRPTAIPHQSHIQTKRTHRALLALGNHHPIAQQIISGARAAELFRQNQIRPRPFKIHAFGDAADEPAPLDCLTVIVVAFNQHLPSRGWTPRTAHTKNLPIRGASLLCQTPDSMRNPIHVTSARGSTRMTRRVGTPRRHLAIHLLHAPPTPPPPHAPPTIAQINATARG